MSFNKITAVSKFLKEHLKSIGISSDIKVIYNGIDLDYINTLTHKNNKNNRLDKKEFILFFPGGMKPLKGGAILLRAIKILNLKNLPIKVIYSGSTTKDFMKENTIENVTFTGFLQHEEYLNKLNDSDCLILPSSIEGFPISIVEAMALGKTIITTPVGGIPEFCINRRNTLYIERKATDVAEKILYLYKNSKLREQISKNNVQDAKRFDLYKITDQYIDLYKSAIYN